MKKYLMRLAQSHETFRRAELDALAVLAKVDLHVEQYDADSPFCIVHLPSDEAARDFCSRAILAIGVYELWGSAADHATLRDSVRTNTGIHPALYKHDSFKFTVNTFRNKRSSSQQRELIESFSFLDLQGPIMMNNASLEMCIFEDYAWGSSTPRQVHLGRWLGGSSRAAVLQYDLKKRSYISRTSMDAELSLVTALLTLAAPGKLMFDPFVGTGSFAVTCGFFGAISFGSDIDGRSFRGTAERSVLTNFKQYGIEARYLDSITSDLNHTPFRQVQFLDGIVCDPPYGVREGPKTLGYREGKPAKMVVIDGVPAHYRDGWVPPKRPYSFNDMLYDVLNFAFATLVDNARLSMWMPTADDEDTELSIPQHPGLALISICVQHFNKWSRRLLTYRRLPHAEIDNEKLAMLTRDREVWGQANDLNQFRRKYFEGFKEQQQRVAAAGESS